MGQIKLPKLLVPGYSTNKKPTCPVEINWKNSLTKKLLFFGIVNKGKFLNLTSPKNQDIEKIPNQTAGIVADKLRTGNGKTASFAATTYSTNLTFAVKANLFTKNNTSNYIFGADNFDWLFAYMNSNNKYQVNFSGGANWGQTTSTFDLNCMNSIMAVKPEDSFGDNGHWFVDGKKESVADSDSNINTNTIDTDILIGDRSSGSRYFDGLIEYVAIWGRTLSDREATKFQLEPYHILKPANDYVYFTSEEAGGGVTGSGSPQAETATSTGEGSVGGVITGSGEPQAETATSTSVGERTITASGSSQAETATCESVGLREITGSGSLQAETATSNGTGGIAGNISGTGEPQAETATTSGSGLRLITTSGSPQAEIATVSGVGLRIVSGSGSPQSDTATSSGIGTIGGAINGTGSPQAETATAAGAGLRIVTGSGEPQTDTSTASGTGLRIVSGSSSPQAETATSSGTGTVGNVVNGTGTPQAETAIATGTGLRVIIGSGLPQSDTATSSGTGSVSEIATGTGSPQAETATASGVGLRIITCAGSPQAETATAYGYETSPTYPSCRTYTVEAENRVYLKEVC